VTFLQAIKSIAAAIAAIVGLFRDGVAAWSAQQERDAGKAEANASTLQQNADRVNEAQAAAAEADADHAKNPAGDAGLDTDFRRSE
jgi:flagellar hook-basal body complex protein FliE